MVLEDDAGLHCAGTRRRGPIDAAGIVAGDVAAQFGELVSVGTAFDRRARAAYAGPPASRQHRGAQANRELFHEPAATAVAAVRAARTIRGA